jgi:hypothetical protein
MLKKILLVAAAAALATASQAQGDFMRRPSPFAGRTLTTLALFEEVRTELKTTDDENKKIDAHVEKLQGELQSAFQDGNGDFDKIRGSVEKLNKKYDDDLGKLLTDDQNKRLKELYVQFNGPYSITNDAISKDLAITDDQKTKIKAAQDDSNKAMREAFSGGGGGDPQETFKKIQTDLRTALEKVLTDDQKTKLKSMEGTKFEFKKG